MKRRILAAIAAAVLSLGVAAPMAYADPAFGPGNNGGGQGNSGPQGRQMPSSGPDNGHAWLQVGAGALKHCVALGCVPEATLL